MIGVLFKIGEGGESAVDVGCYLFSSRNQPSRRKETIWKMSSFVKSKNACDGKNEYEEDG